MVSYCYVITYTDMTMPASSATHDLEASVLLQINHLSLLAGTQPILRGITMVIHGGERVALLGPSGTGKSLLAKALTGILPNDVRCEGQLVLNGHDITRRHPALRPSSARVSMVDQETSTALSPLHTLGQQLMMVCAGAGYTGCSIRWRAESLLAQVGVPKAAMRRYPAELSGGQRQRVCIALALACDTPLLVADEPTSALDALNQQQVVKALSSAVSPTASATSTMSLFPPVDSDTICTPTSPHAKALLFITHDVRAAHLVCDRALVLHKGHIVEDTAMSELLSAPQHAFSQRMVAAFQRERLSKRQQLSPGQRSGIGTDV